MIFNATQSAQLTALSPQLLLADSATGNSELSTTSLNIQTLDGSIAQLNPNFFSIHDGATGSQIYLDPVSDGIVFNNNVNGKTLQIAPGDLSKNMSIKEIDVCSGGVAKKMLVIASDPY